MNELNHNPGKGDKDRSPGWRKNYDDISWTGLGTDNVTRRGNKTRKTYGKTKTSDPDSV